MERNIEVSIINFDEYPKARNFEVSSDDLNRLSDVDSSVDDEWKVFGGPRNYSSADEEDKEMTGNKGTWIRPQNIPEWKNQAKPMPTPKIDKKYNRAVLSVLKVEEPRDSKLKPKDDPWGEALQQPEIRKHINVGRAVSSAIKKAPNVINFSPLEKSQNSSSGVYEEEVNSGQGRGKFNDSRNKTVHRKGKGSMWDRQDERIDEGNSRSVETWAEMFTNLTQNFIRAVIKENPILSDNDLFERLSIEDQKAQNQFKLSEKAPKSSSESQVRITNPASHVPKQVSRMSLDTYKINPCPQGKNCNYGLCIHYHYLAEKRRDPQIYKYGPALCRNLTKGRCSMNDSCKFAHSLNEIYYHDKVYKTSPCIFMQSRQECPFEEVCFYYHSIQEKRNTTAVEPMIEEIKALAEKIDSIQVQINNKSSESKNIQEKVLEMQRSISCMKCLKRERKLYVEPCSHSLCDGCQSLSNPSCGWCGGQISTMTYIKL
jgi:hypothetical protein